MIPIPFLGEWSNIFRCWISWSVQVNALAPIEQSSNSSTSVFDFSGGPVRWELAMVQVTPYQCPKCFKYFKSSKSCCNHRSTCGTDKKFCCALCAYRSHQKGNVLRHLVTQHREASQRRRVNYVLRVNDRGKISFPSNTNEFSSWNNSRKKNVASEILLSRSSIVLSSLRKKEKKEKCKM